MSADPSDLFRIFISHKHDDHDAAENIARAIEDLDSQIQCFVSGSDLVAGSDWNAAIRSQLMASHLLILVFTEPSKTWDWCLYEAGLFNRLGDENSVVCLFRPGDASPRPLSNLQGVSAEAVPVQRFLGQLCKETWLISRPWRRGPLAANIADSCVEDVTQRILAHFPAAAGSAPISHFAHHPCHRVVLDLRTLQGVRDGIPREARVVEGEGATTTFTMSLFNLTHGLRSRTWGDLVDASGVADGQWLTDLNDRFAAALREELFLPSKTTPMPLIDAYSGQRRRSYPPVLYEILREPASGQVGGSGPDARRPLQVTIVLGPVLESA